MPVLAVRLEHDIFAKNEVRCCLLRSLAERLAFLRAVDAIQAYALRLFVMQDFDRVAVNNGDDEEVDPGVLLQPRVEAEIAFLTHVEEVLIVSADRQEDFSP